MFDALSGRRAGSDSEGVRLFTVGLLVGAVVGATAALLMAPATGAETRSVLRRKARLAAKRGGEVIDEKWTDAERAARRAARLGLKRARRQAQHARGMAEDFLDAGKRRLGVD